MPECLTSDLLLRLTGGLGSGGIYALIAIGYTLVYGVQRLINFAHSEVFMVGVLSGFLFLTAVVPTDTQWGALYLVAAFVPAMLASGVLAMGVERVAYRPLRRRGATGLSYLISAIGMSLFLQYATQYWRGTGPENYPSTIQNVELFTVAGVGIFLRDAIVVVVAVAMVVALEAFLNGTRSGRGIRAIAQDSQAAALMGVNIDRSITLTFFIGGLLAGAGGLLFGLAFERTQWNIGFLPGIKAFTAAVLGGIGSIRGALVGGLLLGVLENVSAGCFGAQWRDVVAFTALVAVLMFKPTGLFGAKE